MSEIVAVHDLLLLVEYIPTLKREALMFDRIAFPYISRTIENLRENHPHSNEEIDEVEWLLDEGIIIDHGLSVDTKLLEFPEYKEFINHFVEQLKETQRIRKIFIEEAAVLNEYELVHREAEILRQESRLFSLNARQVSLQMRLLKNIDAYPVLSSFIANVDRTEAMDDILEVVINEFPIPDANTSWEQIKEFRSDPDSRAKFFSLKNWMNEVSRLELPRIQVEDKLRANMADYDSHMKLHKMKTRRDTLRTIVCTHAGFLTGAKVTGWGNLITAAGMIISPLFSVAQHRIKLLEGERGAPGREIAYILKSQEQFRK